MQGGAVPKRRPREDCEVGKNVIGSHYLLARGSIYYIAASVRLLKNTALYAAPEPLSLAGLGIGVLATTQ